VIATERIQPQENARRQSLGEIPADLKVQHGVLKKELVEIAEKWHRDWSILALHNLKHE